MKAKLIINLAELKLLNSYICFFLIKMSIYNLYILIILILIGICYFFYLHRKNALKDLHPISSDKIKIYIGEHFSDYEVLEEITPKNINKTFCMQKNSQDFILKITCKDIKRAYREATLLGELSSQIQVPELISSSVMSIPGHILMSHCGIRISKLSKEENYFNFGKIISSISSVIISNSTKKILKKNRTKYIKKLRTKVNCNHPYAQYFYDYQHLSRNYFCHGDMHINQAMVDACGCITIIDWESAALSYRVFDLSRALSHCLKQTLSINYAQSILLGYIESARLDDPQEIQLLLSLIWYDLNKTHYQWVESGTQQKRVDFIGPILMGKSLENIFNLKY